MEPTDYNVIEVEGYVTGSNIEFEDGSIALGIGQNYMVQAKQNGAKKNDAETLYKVAKQYYSVIVRKKDQDMISGIEKGGRIRVRGTLLSPRVVEGKAYLNIRPSEIVPL
jgi:hypothetical protein